MGKNSKSQLRPIGMNGGENHGVLRDIHGAAVGEGGWREAEKRSLRILAEGSSTTQALGGPPLKESGNTDKTKVKVTEEVQHCSLEIKVGLKFLLLRMQQKSKLDIK